VEQNDKKNFLINFTFTIIICAVIFVIGKFTLQYLTPFVLAVIIAYFMQRPARFIEKNLKISKSISAAILAAGVYILVAAIFLFLLYRLFAFSGTLVESLPEFISYVSGVTEKLENTFYMYFEKISPEISNEIVAALKENVGNFTVTATNYISHTAAVSAKNTPSFLFSSIVALVASCYIAKDYDGLKRFFKSLCPVRVYENIIKIKLILSQSFLKLIKGYVFLTIATYIQLIIGFWLLRIKYAPLLALIVAVIDLLPVLGTGTVLLPWGIILIAMGDGFKGFGILLLYLTITVIRNFLEPKIIGSQIGINPLFTLLAMFIGLKVFGFWGIIILPVALIVTIKYYKNEMETDKM